MSALDQELVDCFIEEAKDILNKWEKICLSINENSTTDDFDDLFRCAHNLKGSSRAVGLLEFGEFVHQVEDGIALIKNGSAQSSAAVGLALLKAQGILSAWIDRAAQGNPTERPAEESNFLSEYQAVLRNKTGPSEVPTFAIPETPIHAPIQAEMHSPGESAPEEVIPPVAAAPTAPAEKGEIKPSPVAAAKTAQTRDETLRVSSKKLDAILDLVGELSLHQAIVAHARGSQHEASDNAINSLFISQKLTKEIYEKALALRLAPIQPAFQRLERTIKEVAAQLGKTVEVTSTGGDVEIEKTVGERIIEPLTHMVRNAVDHGLESTEGRIDSGKDPHGRIWISALQENNSVLLVIQDDGKGIDPAKITQKAIEKKLIKPDAQLTPEETLALIFLPGFSTSEKVTDVSGRGVGMDVVMRTVEELQGKVNISSTLGKGTRFTIQLPTSMSIVDALIVELSGLEYAVPIAGVDEILTLVEGGINPDTDVITHRGSVVSLVDASHFVKPYRANATQTCIHPQSALVTLGEGRRVAFKIDRVLGQQQIVIKKFSTGMDGVFGFTGGTILSTGQPGLILDIQALGQKYISQTTSTRTMGNAA
jgi:two-component system chemotaxis sensor kinase CheA